MPTTVIYARVSSISDRQSTDRQVDDLTRYAKAMNYQILKVFQEKASGALKNGNRPVLLECLKFCKDHHPDFLLISEISRLGRNTAEVLKTIQELSELKISVYIQNLGLYTLTEDKKENPITSMIVTVMAEMAKIERANIVYRLNSGRKRYIEKGGKLGRPEGSKMSAKEIIEKYPRIVRRLKKNVNSQVEI